MENSKSQEAQNQETEKGGLVFKCASCGDKLNNEGALEFHRCPAPQGTAQKSREGFSVSSRGGLRANKGKPRLSLVPIEAMEAIATVLYLSSTEGGGKYPMDNWKKLDNYQEMTDSALRHGHKAVASPGALDPESGLPHDWHALVNWAMIVANRARGNFSPASTTPAPPPQAPTRAANGVTMKLGKGMNLGGLLGMLAMSGIQVPNQDNKGGKE